ncbi:hypothetical protein B0H66DRAFT_61150 [Apodospora peruviana]|uniref:Uncharacterized protein n=1 Tax=Apodospora peruviana TaxID=516989 RepID=A0AAE0ITR5_9PEZI|nr:hypothetical protein B0H66DRAFT_61150 [Apodospora peruviana]
MKGIVKIALAAAMVAGVAAEPHSHNHNHFHRHRAVKRQDQSPVEKRDIVYVTEVVEGPVVTKFVLDGEVVDEEEAKKGIEEGLFAVVGSTKPSFSAPPAVYSTSIATTSSTAKGGQFFEQKATSTSSAPPPPATTAAKSSTSSGGSGVDREFRNGEEPCSTFPEEYGALPVPWLKTEGWVTIMRVRSWIPGVKFDNIQVPVSGGCEKGDMCSYACPPGYQKTQWPEKEQGATGQSVGGLWCNDQGMLELTRPEYRTICAPGAGGVFIRNELSGTAALCRTDYPGSEAMTIPLETFPGGTYPVTNPLSSTGYIWEGARTTAQYYLNNKDVALEDACVWDSKPFPDRAGNWAPTNIGVGKDDSGITYLSIFPNAPTSHAILDYDVEIEGDISGECWLRNGQYSGSNGCTVGIIDGGEATIVLKERS